MSRLRLRIASLTILLCTAAAPAFAQAPEPPKIWTVALSGGLALTSGNTDTSNVNAAYDIV